jgi:hypothetical protein
MSEKIRYNFENLKNFCEENKIDILEEFNEQNVNCNIKITGKCITPNCSNFYCKKFHILFKTKIFKCKKCCIKDGLVKQQETFFKKYSVTNISNLEEIKNKKIKTCLEKYGVDNPAKSQIVKDKMLVTLTQKYNMIPKKILSEEDKNNKLIEKYGTINFRNSEIIKNKIKNTCIEKYGVDHISKSKHVQEIKTKNNLEKYGCEFTSQIPEIAEKITKSGFRLREFIFPSGKIVKVQGYEPFALRDLIEIEKINENCIITGCTNVPEIWYNDKLGKKHRHYVDIYIPSQNRCIEIKSSWTIKKENVFLKQNAAKELGFNYEIWVYNDKGNTIQKY